MADKCIQLPTGAQDRVQKRPIFPLFGYRVRYLDSTSIIAKILIRHPRKTPNQKAAETHMWSPMKPSKEEIMKHIRKNVKIDKKRKGK